MNTALLDQTERLREALHALGDAQGGFALDREYFLVIAGTLAQAVGLRLKLEALARDIERIDSAVEIDPDDLLSDSLLNLQRQTNTIHTTCLNMDARLNWRHRIPLRLLCRLLRSIHGRSGRLRTYIMEFDADASGLSGQGPFTNADDLFRSLDA